MSIQSLVQGQVLATVANMTQVEKGYFSFTRKTGQSVEIIEQIKTLESATNAFGTNVIELRNFEGKVLILM